MTRYNITVEPWSEPGKPLVDTGWMKVEIDEIPLDETKLDLGISFMPPPFKGMFIAPKSMLAELTDALLKWKRDEYEYGVDQ